MQRAAYNGPTTSKEEEVALMHASWCSELTTNGVQERIGKDYITLCIGRKSEGTPEWRTRHL